MEWYDAIRSTVFSNNFLTLEHSFQSNIAASMWRLSKNSTGLR